MNPQKNHYSQSDPEYLKLLLTKEESATLEFKREWYKLSGEGKKHQTGELIKDILSLANGNAYSVGETGFLIVGVDEKQNEDGKRLLHDVGKDIPTAISILDIVRSYCHPPLDYLEIIPFEIDGNNLFGIVIPSTPHIYETIHEISTAKNFFPEYMVFIRRDEGVRNASTKEREAIKKLKEIYFTEKQNAPPVLYGVGVGATVGGILLPRISQKLSGTREGFIAGLIVGPILGGFLGSLIGNGYRTIIATKANWSRITPLHQFVALTGGIFATIITWLFGLLIDKELKKSQPKQEKLSSE